jgi:putative ABC transport system permease protein
VNTTLAGMLVRLSAWLAPRNVRARWREEWLGEIEGQRAEGKGQRGSWRTLRAALGAPWDAIVLRGRSAHDPLRSVGAGFQTDLSQTVRALWRAPSHVATVVICLGIGTSITVSVFSALNALLFGEMPGVADRRSVVRLSLRYEAGAGTADRIYVPPTGGPTLTGGPWSTSDFETLDASRGGALAGLAVEGDWRFDISLDRDPMGMTGAFVSGEYFDVLGTTPSMGRLLKPSDDRPDAPAVAVIGYHLWLERFDGAPNIVGRSILVADRPFTVVGVAPPRFTGVQPTGLGESPLNATQLWLPLHHAIGWPGVPDREVPWHSAVGRLAPRATQDDARSAMTFGAQRLAAAHPLNRRGAIVIVHDHTLGPNDSPLEILTMVTVLLSLPLTVLLIGCANVANLQIARASERARELSVRCALGASRAQVIRLLTCEAAILAVLSVGAGWMGAQVILTIAQPSFPVALALDGRVLAFALLLTVGVTVLSGLTPAWWGTRRADLMLRHTGRTGGTGHSRLRHALVIVQMALSLVLLATSGLFMASLRAMREEVPPAARTTLVVPLDVDTLGYTAADTTRLREEVTTRLAEHPSVQSVAAERLVGFRYWAPTDAIDTRRYVAGGYVTPSWFETVGARLVAGRLVQESDTGTTAVVSERLARELAPNGSALGRLIYLSNSVIAAQSARWLGRSQARARRFPPSGSR